MQDKDLPKLFAPTRTGTSLGQASLVLLGAAVTLVAACSSPGADPLATTSAALSTPYANDKPAYDFFAAKGLTNFQAAGIVGNLDQESGVNPTISQSGGGPGRGIAQWSAGARWDTTPGDNLVAYAAMQGTPTSSLTTQLGFMWYELQTFPAYGLANLRATTNVTDATRVVEDQFEGCVYANFPVCNLPQRITYAKNVLAAYGADPVPLDAGITDDAGLTKDGAATGDATTSDVGGARDDAGTPADSALASDAGNRDTGTNPDAASAVPTDDAGAPDKSSDAGSTSGAGGMPASTHARDASSGGCAMKPIASERSSGGYALVAIGLMLESARRRRARPDSSRAHRGPPYTGLGRGSAWAMRSRRNWRRSPLVRSTASMRVSCRSIATETIRMSRVVSMKFPST